MAVSISMNAAKRPLIGAALIAAVAAALMLSAGIWFPPLQQRWSLLGGGDDAPEDDAGHHGGGLPPDVLKLTPEAQRSQGIEIEPLVRSDHERVIPIPGHVSEIGGVTHRDVTTKTSGEIAKIYALQGQLVRAGDPLFDISLTHQEAIQHQIDLLDALAKLEVANAEIARLELVERATPGGLPGIQLLNQRYERRHLQHTVASRRQILILLGLAEAAVDDLIRRHQLHGPVETDSPPQDHPHSSAILDRVTIYAPAASSDSATPSPELFVVEDLSVHQGEHVDVGKTLCRLGDYRRLYIAGQTFERDIEPVRGAMNRRWTVDAAITQRDGKTSLSRDLPIVYIDSQVDETTRSARFYVELENSLATPLETMQRPFADWRYRPGQRIELRVPVEKFKDRLVVPVEAVVRDGLENYVFQVSGDTFVRRAVEIEYRDEEKAILAEGQVVGEGVRLAMSGAYQLQLALLNRASGPAEHHHH